MHHLHLPVYSSLSGRFLDVRLPLLRYTPLSEPVACSSTLALPGTPASARIHEST